MDTSPNVILRLVKDTARRFADERLRRLAGRRGLSGDFGALIDDFCELGLNLVDFPREVGGLELGPLADCLVAESLAHGDVDHAFALPVPGAFAAIMACLGDAKQRLRWLADFALLPQATRGSVALGPPGSVRACIGDDGCITLHGELPAVWHLNAADRLVVIADVDGADVASDGPVKGPKRHLVAAVLALPHQGVSVGKALVLPGLPTSEAAGLVLDGAMVGPEANLSASCVYAANVTLLASLGIRMASFALGAARAASSYVLAFAERRRQAGRPLAHFQSMGFLLVDMHLACETALKRLRRAAEAFEAALAVPNGAGLDEDLLEALDVARVEAEEVAFFVTDSALQILDDGDGDDDKGSHPIASWHQDVKLLTHCYALRAFVGQAPAYTQQETHNQTLLLC